MARTFLMHRRTYRLIVAGLALLLCATAWFWWFLPAWPRVSFRDTPTSIFLVTVKISEDGKTLASHGVEGVTLWNPATGQKKAHVPESESCWEFWIAPDGSIIMSQNDFSAKGSVDRELRVWKSSRSPNLVYLFGSGDTDGVIGFTRNGKILITGAEGARIKLWSTSTWRRIPFHPLEAEQEYEVASAANDRCQVAIEVEKGNLTNVLDLEKRARRTKLVGASWPCGVSGDGKFLAAYSGDRIKIWDLLTGREKCTIPKDLSAGDPDKKPPKLSPNGERLIAMSAGESTLWDTTTDPPHQVGEILPDRCEFSAAGDRILVHLNRQPSSTDAGWELRDTATLRECLIHYEWGEARFSPDGKTIYCWDEDANNPSRPHHQDRSLRNWVKKLLGTEESGPGSGREITIWETAHGEKLAVFEGYESAVPFPDSHTWALVRGDGTIDIWDLPLRRPWWVEYGLSVLFVLLAFAAVSYWRWRRKHNISR